jgi:hypothetical protein
VPGDPAERGPREEQEGISPALRRPDSAGTLSSDPRAVVFEDAATVMAALGTGQRVEPRLAEYSQLLHHSERVAVAPAFNGLSVFEPQGAHRPPFDSPTCWCDPLQRSQMSATAPDI